MLYATVTVEEPNTAGDKVSITVEPLIDRAETVVGEPSTNTAKSVVAAVVAFATVPVTLAPAIALKPLPLPVNMPVLAVIFAAVIGFPLSLLECVYEFIFY